METVDATRKDQLVQGEGEVKEEGKSQNLLYRKANEDISEMISQSTLTDAAHKS